MVRKRQGNADDDLPPPPSPGTSINAPKKRGRKPSHTEHWTKVTVVLFDRQIVFLDRLGADIRATSGVAISRAHVIRALIDSLGESDLDLRSTRSEADLRALLIGRLGRHQARRRTRAHSRPALHSGRACSRPGMTIT